MEIKLKVLKSCRKCRRSLSQRELKGIKRGGNKKFRRESKRLLSLGIEDVPIISSGLVG